MKAFALQTLRFLNLLEPGRNILSITKTAMWVSLVAIVVSLVNGAADPIGPLSAFFASSSLYAWRRYVFWKTGQPGTGGGLAHGWGPRPELDMENDDPGNRAG